MSPPDLFCCCSEHSSGILKAGRAFPSMPSPWGGRVPAGTVPVALAALAVLPQGSRAPWYCLSGRLVASELPNFPSHLQSAARPAPLAGDEWSYYICTILSCPPAKLPAGCSGAGEGWAGSRSTDHICLAGRGRIEGCNKQHSIAKGVGLQLGCSPPAASPSRFPWPPHHPRASGMVPGAFLPPSGVPQVGKSAWVVLV